MTTIGFDRPLYILPFDHRGSFQKNLFGWSGTLTIDRTAQIATAKQVIYDGFRAALKADTDMRARRRVAQCILHQVRQGLRQEFLVAAHGRNSSFARSNSEKSRRR